MCKKVNTRYAADVSVCNGGGIILWIEADGGDLAKVQEEMNGKFGRVSQCTIKLDKKNEFYLIHKNRRYYLSEFYRR